MTNNARFERNALAGMKPGLDSALSEINVQLKKYAGTQGNNTAALEAARNELSRLIKVLKNAHLHGEAAFCAEMEAVLDVLSSQPDSFTLSHGDVLQHALLGLVRYLDALADGADKTALNLFPDYRELQQLRGMEIPSELSLFYPGLAVYLPQRVLNAALPDGDVPVPLKTLRHQYQQGLLQWLRQDNALAGLQAMQLALNNLMRCMPQDESRALWWVASGLLDCLEFGGLPSGSDARKLLGSIDRQIRAVIEGQGGESCTVMNEMLYLVGRSHTVSDLVDEIKQAYALDFYLPEPPALPQSEAAQFLDAMRGQLHGAEESWERCAQGNNAACEKFIGHAAQIAVQGNKLGHNPLQYLTGQIQALSQYASRQEYVRLIAMDMAMALLLLGSGIQRYGSLKGNFQKEARILSERVQAAVRQQPEDHQRLAELIRLHCLLEQDDAMVSLFNEMLANLQHVEKGLYAFFSNPAKRDELGDLLQMSGQIQSGLRIASLKQAEQLLASIQVVVRRFTQCEETPDQTEINSLANAVAVLGSYLRHLASGQAAETLSLQVALSEVSELRQAPVEAPNITPELHYHPVVMSRSADEDKELLEVFLDEAQEVLHIMRDNLNACQLHPDNLELLVTIRQGFHTLKGSGRMVGLAELGEVAWSVERVLKKWLHDNKPATPELLGFITEAEQKFAGWVDALGSHGEVSIEASGLDATAQQIEGSAELEQVEEATASGEPNRHGSDDMHDDEAGHQLSDILPLAPSPQFSPADLAGGKPEEQPLILPAEDEANKPLRELPVGASPEEGAVAPPVPADGVVGADKLAAPDTVFSATPVAVTPRESVATGKPQVRDDLDTQLLPVFLEEADDLCARIDAGLRAWRGQPHDELQLQLLKRLLHTLKGSARMAGAMRIGEAVHEMEDRMLASVDMRGQPGYWDNLKSNFDRITALLEEVRGSSANAMEKGWRQAADGDTERAMLRVRADLVDRLTNEVGEISMARSRMETEMRAFKEGLLELTGSVARLRKQLREVEMQAESQIQAHSSLAGGSAEQFDPLEFDRFTRLQELTRFMNESVHDVQTVQLALLKNFDGAAAAMALQARLNRGLQQSLMKMHMLPFSSISERLYRVVRQTAKELNKRANLELSGTGLELDRSVLEKMTAPLEHLLRNALAHGLETDQVRKHSGKKPIGEIRLGLRHAGSELVFEFSDDGSGLDFAALREKAVAKGLLKPGEAASDDQLAQLILTSGISTANEVTEVAGRGIGMDVVCSEIAALGGRIAVSSQKDVGTQFTIHLPLTLAITHVLMVRSGGETYAIPSNMVDQVRQVKPAELAQFYRERQIEWQGNAYPLRYLPHLLGDARSAPENLRHNPLLLLRSGEQRIALHVDGLLGNQEAMVKNIGPQLAQLPVISGATVQGNGTVVLILDPAQLAQRSVAAAQPAGKAAPEKPLSSPLVMVVDDSLTVRKITTRLLMRAGYQVATAKDGVDALEQLGEISPAVLLLDIEMPRMDGFELARHLRREVKTQSLPIIMITSRTADKHRDHAMQLGVNAYLGKPYQEDALLQQIAGLIVPPEANQQAK